MRLLRVQVPDFRVLQNVDITFEKDFFPNIFPLGSQNGGGKSTLLQLIFGLLHCSGNPDRVEFLKNLLDGIEINDREKIIALIDIWDGEKPVALKFLIKDIKRKFSSDGVERMERIQEIKRLNSSINNTVYNSINKIIEIEICACSFNINTIEDRVLVCCLENTSINKGESFLKKLSEKIFFAAPVTQVLLFLSPKSRKLLFKERNEENDYYSQLQDTKSKLPGFFTYDFLAVDLLVESFKAARDKDFIKAIETGEYGNSYQELIKNINLLLPHKKINFETDFSGVNFKLDKDGETVELYPEDLSHGELKRLSIYMWLKYYNIENAIVLMDEIEIAFHPDWQYQIIADLKEWTPSNQYILATHSYELCQALTPSHVKELEPKLLKQQASN